MDKEQKNRTILISVISILLIIVVAVFIYLFFHSQKKEQLKINLEQIYLSEYNLVKKGDFYFSQKNNYLYAIVNNKGQEIYKGTEGIFYDGIYLTKDGNYLIYSNQNNNLTTYLFDGTKLTKQYEISDVYYVKPILYHELNNDYIIGFTSSNEDTLYLYGLNNTGIIALKDCSLVGDLYKNDIYYTNNDQYYIISNKNNLMGLIDHNGQSLIDFKYKNLYSTENNTFVALNSQDKYGLIDAYDQALIKFKNDLIIPFKDNYLVVKSERMALYNNEYQNLTGFKLNYNKSNYNLRNSSNVNLYQIKDKIIIINNYKMGSSSVYKNLYLLKNNKIVKTITQTSFGKNALIYSYYNNLLTIYNDNFEVQKKLTITNKDIKYITKVSLIQNQNYEIEYFDNKNKKQIIYYNEDGEQPKFKYGNLVYQSQQYMVYKENNNKYNIISNENKLLKTITSEKIKEYNEYFIIDKGLYKITIN